jgi:hypothetical protein
MIGTLIIKSGDAYIFVCVPFCVQSDFGRVNYEIEI